jgi:hypothetical protein
LNAALCSRNGQHFHTCLEGSDLLETLTNDVYEKKEIIVIIDNPIYEIVGGS